MKNGKILIADDDELNRDNITQLLQDEYEIKAVCDGREGIEAFLENNFDLVITDLRMPNIDGMEFLKFIKENNRDNIVIVITG
jgi:CheY-like chemotaxis protein